MGVGRLLQEVRLTPRLTAHGGRHRLELHLGAGGLRAALAWELARALMGAPALRECDGMRDGKPCGQLHAPRARTGSRSFCSECSRHRADERAAKKDYRARIRKARERRRQGWNPRRIAAEVYGRAQVSPEELARVRRWVATAHRLHA